MSLRSVMLAGVFGLIACVVAGAWLNAGRTRHVSAHGDNGSGIGATLETLVPSHKDPSFRFVLGNRSDRDYQLPDDSDLRILGRSRSHGDFVSSAGDRGSGELPLVVPARRNIHLALVWTRDRDVDPANMSEVVERLNLTFFVGIRFGTIRSSFRWATDDGARGVRPVPAVPPAVIEKYSCFPPRGCIVLWI